MLKQWKVNKTNSAILSAALSLILILVAWQLSNFWQLNRWQQALLEQLTIVEQKNIASKKVKTDVVLEQAPKMTTNTRKSLSLVQVDLPAIPLAEKLMTTKPHKKDEVQAKPKKQSNLAMSGKNKPKRQNVSVMYQQLISDKSISIEIAWPNDGTDRQNTFSFLYQCLGMKFGVLNWKKGNEAKVTLAKNPHQSLAANNGNQVSDWLRIAQGQLARQEQDWLKQYSLSGTPVRLFPKAVDWQLARLLTKQLNNTPLTSFRARYKYDNKQFMLTNIQLNGQLLANNWTLIVSKCSI